MVLISGTGSNLAALIEAAAANAAYEISAVISNRPGAAGLLRAVESGVATAVLDHREFASRADFDQALALKIDSYNADLVVLAGFMRILTREFVLHFSGRLLNIHPSLLPKYPGLNTHQRALDAGDRYAGATVHFVTEELDGGPPLLQAPVPVEDGDNAQRLAERVLLVEHRIYPTAVQWFAEGRAVMRDNRAWLDGECLPAHGKQLEN